MTARRIERINELIRREVSEIIQREMKDPGIGFVTVIRVTTTNDLYYSTIYASVMGDERARETTIEQLNKAAGYIQHLLSGRITLRNMPRISFKLDTSIDYSLRINEVLDKIAKEKSQENPEDAKEEQDNEQPE
jgi:ribosome-binding factor A